MSLLKNRLGRKRDSVQKESSESFKSLKNKSSIIDALQKKIDSLAKSDNIKKPPVFLESRQTDFKSNSSIKSQNNTEESARLPGKVVATPLGNVWVNRIEYKDYYHGDKPADAYLKAGRSLGILARNPGIEKLDPSGALFVDTETTGLSGGSGTIPFLIGVGWFTESAFIVEHLFCRTPDEEPAQLYLLTKHMKRAEYLVSFNGKSFDIPLINNRFIMNRIANPGYNLSHLDLLHLSRRVFGRRLTDRSLQNLERVVLNFKREGDIPGSEIPDVYKAYLSGEDKFTVAKVLEHNALDIVALAALGGELDNMYRNPDSVAFVQDSLGLAREAFGAGAVTNGTAHLNHAGVMGSMDEKTVALHMAARYEAKKKSYKKAASIWLEIIKLDKYDASASLSLAKYYEHREKNLERALKYAKKTAEIEGESASEHRQNRIKRKMAKQKSLLS